MPVVKALDRKVGPVQYQARWIDKEQRLCKLLVPHLGNTSTIVIILRVSIFGGLKTRVIFYEKDKNRIAKLELIITREEVINLSTEEYIPGS